MSRKSYYRSVLEKFAEENSLYKALFDEAVLQNNKVALKVLTECKENGENKLTLKNEEYISTGKWALDLVSTPGFREFPAEFDVIFEKAVADDNKVAIKVLSQCKKEKDYNRNCGVMSALCWLPWSPEVEATCEWIVDELKEKVTGSPEYRTFFVATRYKNIDMIRWAIKKGGDVNEFEDEFSCFDSIGCAFKGYLHSQLNLDIMDTLMAAGLDLSKSGHYALHACDGFPLMAKRVLLAGAKPLELYRNMPKYTTIESTESKNKLKF